MYNIISLPPNAESRLPLDRILGLGRILALNHMRAHHHRKSSENVHLGQRKLSDHTAFDCDRYPYPPFLHSRWTTYHTHALALARLTRVLTLSALGHGAGGYRRFLLAQDHRLQDLGLDPPQLLLIGKRLLREVQLVPIILEKEAR